MIWPEKYTHTGLALGVTLVAALTLGPVFLPRPQVPTVTHTELAPVDQTAAPLPASASSAAPDYPTSASITPLISGKLNLNTATLEQLESLPRIGPALAQRIMAARPYHSLRDFDQVRGIGPAALKTLSPLVTW